MMATNAHGFYAIMLFSENKIGVDLLAGENHVE